MKKINFFIDPCEHTFNSRYLMTNNIGLRHHWCDDSHPINQFIMQQPGCVPLNPGGMPEPQLLLPLLYGIKKKSSQIQRRRCTLSERGHSCLQRGKNDFHRSGHRFETKPSERSCPGRRLFQRQFLADHLVLRSKGFKDSPCSAFP